LEEYREKREEKKACAGPENEKGRVTPFTEKGKGKKVEAKEAQKNS